MHDFFDFWQGGARIMQWVIARATQVLRSSFISPIYGYVKCDRCILPIYPDVGCGRPWHSISHCSNKSVVDQRSTPYSATPNVLTIICQPTLLSWRESCYFQMWHSVCKITDDTYIRGKGVVTRLQQIVQWGLINVPSNRRCRSRLSSMYVYMCVGTGTGTA